MTYDKFLFSLFITFSVLGFSNCYFGQKQSINLMSYNIRYNNPNDGPNWWKKRKEKVTNIIKKHSPDVMGLQEVLKSQLFYLDSILADYNFYSVGREDGKMAGEHASIFYKKNKYQLKNSGTFWLSNTPEKISVGWDAAMERICSWVFLMDKKSGKSFYVFNAHFDHLGEIARKKSADLIIKRIEEIAKGETVFFMGDLNFEPSDAPYDIILKNGFLDSYKNTKIDCTYTGFDVKKKNCKRIDYIFTSEKLKIKSFIIDDKNDGHNFPSDHLPVITKVVY